MSVTAMTKQLAGFAHEATVEYDTDSEGLSAESLAIILGAIRDCRADLATLYDKVQQDLIHATDSERFVVPGFGEVTITKSNTYKDWDHDGLTRVLVAMALDERIVDMETGEYERESEAVARVLSECARPAWRTTPLKARHIQVDEFCKVTLGAKSVRLPPR